MIVGVEMAKDSHRNNCRVPDVEHVFNVLGTIESCRTEFCLIPDGRSSDKFTIIR